jgi:LPXTG-site transpeptidase (sortase) family protein
VRTLLSLLGNLLLVCSLGGLALLAFSPTNGHVTEGAEAGTPIEVARPPIETSLSTGQLPSPDPSMAPGEFRTTTPSAVPYLPITRVVVPGLPLEADVVPARLIERNGATTWEVPAFKAGHAEHTAGAGGLGNAVLLGHVSSRSSGNVFKDLDRVQIGDALEIFSGPDRFDYRVAEIRSVARHDVSALEPTETASVSLLTCTGLWLPLIWDYTERLIVRAELVSRRADRAPVESPDVVSGY